MKTIFYSSLFGVVAIYLGLNLAKPSLPEMGQVLPFSFTNSDASEFSSSTMKNKVWVFNLFFTSCQGPCPLITGNLKTVYDKFVSNADFSIVSVSVDPERDTPEKLLAYAKRFAVDPRRWFFLTGPEQVMREVALNSFKLGTQDDAKIHSNRLVLIDRSGNIRGYYVGIVPDDIEKLKNDISSIL